MAKVIAVDFDNTLFTDEYPDIGKPILPMIEWCKEQKKLGNKLILWTCREGIPLEQAIDACFQYGLVFDYVNENTKENLERTRNDCRKIGADMYVDDKSVHIDTILYNDVTPQVDKYKRALLNLATRYAIDTGKVLPESEGMTKENQIKMIALYIMSIEVEKVERELKEEKK